MTREGCLHHNTVATYLEATHAFICGSIVGHVVRRATLIS